MDPKRSTDRILDEWDAVTSAARPPAAAPRRRTSLAGVASGLSLAGAGVLAAALVLGVVYLGGRIAPSVGALGTVSPPASAPSNPSQAAIAATPVPSHVAPSHPVASRAPSSNPATPPPTPTCSPDVLSARITAWDGAAGSRIADVKVTNTSAVACILPEPASLALRDGSGRTLISGSGPAGAAATVPAGSSVTTLVQTSNYCGAAPVAPVTIRFDLGGGHRVTAEPPTPNDATVPPCNGSTVPASIQMHPWSR